MKNFNRTIESAIWGGWENVPQYYKDKCDREYRIDTEQINEFDCEEEGYVLYE